MSDWGDVIRRALAQHGDKALRAGAAALYAEALDIQKASMRRTPVLTGALRASHEVTRPEVSRTEASVKILVGGPAAPYAVPVHERLDLKHRVGEAKFLERSVLEATAGFEERLAARLRRALGS